MTNRQVYEEAAGIELCDEFFEYNNINPDAEYEETIKNNQFDNK